MPCRIGITTDPEARRVYWQKQAIGLANWQVLEMFRSKAAAKEYETQYALRHGCKVAPGDLDLLGREKELATEHEYWWYVYHFDYEPEKPNHI
ncbi:MAG TPA: hypothetical protein VIH69_04460 [Dehalococcoidia bacterium]